MDVRGTTVLVVEDDEPIRALITATLPEDWAVVEAADGMEALALAREHQPDAVLLDHDLPLLDGVEICRVLRRDPATDGCRIIAVTANDDPRVRDAFTGAGADAVLTKPFSPMQLLQMLETWERTRG